MTNKIRPFLKWPGNKFRCLQHILPRLPKEHRLIEPFAGSGAIFLNSQYSEYLLSDKNSDLIQLFINLKNHQQDFIQYCGTWFKTKNNNKTVFYELRQQFNESCDPYLRSALFLYLNRHGYNGLCRYNLKGKYNVPFGQYVRPYFPKKELENFIHKAHHASFLHQDFTDTFENAQSGDVIYCDPPYVPISKTSNFTSYTKGTFLDREQQLLASYAKKACEKGAHVFISNHDLPYTRHLYQDASQIISFPVSRTIACQGTKRIPVIELLAHYQP